MTLLRLYPAPAQACSLEGLYLDTPLAHATPDSPFVYSNFVTSLDGRVAVENQAGQDEVPTSVANRHDWRLYQELAARADALLIGGRYFRQLAEGRAQAALPVADEPAFGDLLAWRRAQGLRPQPDVVVLSNTLDFSLPETLLEQGRRVLIFVARPLITAERRARLTAQGAEVIGLDAEPDAASVTRELDVRQVVRALGERGYRRVYSVAGPYSLHSLLRHGVVDTLFVTQRLAMIGGERYQSLLEGPSLATPAGFSLASLYYQESVDGDAGQLFARFDRRPGADAASR
ncbi:dihydrofolate reductase family protein [Halomonas sp. HP20-15]|uniref:RibD family protein n=1 Tax=Halomonas sp. HP20-15 TaxID=3085901 RepID=UPI002980E9DC|nr:dihydrofolate reductase family protein [Halomonas sp. HP20-15]MDW5376162.1 dihydrofolate reductase family protein [Halomonas sp. HP20-15]